MFWLILTGLFVIVPLAAGSMIHAGGSLYPAGEGAAKVRRRAKTAARRTTSVTQHVQPAPAKVMR